MGKPFFISLIVSCHEVTRSMGTGKALSIIYLDFNNAFNIAGR